MITKEKLAIVFPGQGSQSVGMLSDIALTFPEVKHTFDQASNVLGYDLWELVQEGPATKLAKTAYTQPAILVASYAIWKLLTPIMGVSPSILSGHSLGEYTALVCGNALSFEDAVELVAARGEYMQEAVAEDLGGMAAIIGLDDSVIDTICKEVKSKDEILSPANFNSPGQVVIAGHKEAVKRAISLAKEKGAKLTTLLPVSVPSHCQLMEHAASRLKILLDTISIKQPTLPILNNVDVLLYKTPEGIRDGLTRQLYNPVRWVEIIKHLVSLGITEIIECGPGKVLTGLNKRIDRNLKLMSASDIKDLTLLMQSDYTRSV